MGRDFFCIKFGIGRRSDVASNAEQGAESVKWVGAAVEAGEAEFVELGLQVLRADAVVSATQPCFEMGEHEVNDRQEGLGNVHVATFRDGAMALWRYGNSRVRPASRNRPSRR